MFDEPNPPWFRSALMLGSFGGSDLNAMEINGDLFVGLGL